MCATEKRTRIVNGKKKRARTEIIFTLLKTQKRLFYSRFTKIKSVNLLLLFFFPPDWKTTIHYEVTAKIKNLNDRSDDFRWIFSDREEKKCSFFLRANSVVAGWDRTGARIRRKSALCAHCHTHDNCRLGRPRLSVWRAGPDRTWSAAGRVRASSRRRGRRDTAPAVTRLQNDRDWALTR